MLVTGMEEFRKRPSFRSKFKLSSPETMCVDDLRSILLEYGVSQETLKVAGERRSEVLALYYRVCLPLGQRTLPDTFRGQAMEKKRLKFEKESALRRDGQKLAHGHDQSPAARLFGSIESKLSDASSSVNSKRKSDSSIDDASTSKKSRFQCSVDVPTSSSSQKQSSVIRFGNKSPEECAMNGLKREKVCRTDAMSSEASGRDPIKSGRKTICWP
ncbi:unnamed protein product [Notodromas monacha]|uniref:Ashwin n=1 Tax=Notodromas monacha TaxID=399045 RepID=A0A7R9GAC2_9CRUS|nr:unnamed protein product [Notodromas monacha]CAG0913849.1 unnamed protein product [Notodromas monacha]